MSCALLCSLSPLSRVVFCFCCACKMQKTTPTAAAVVGAAAVLLCGGCWANLSKKENVPSVKCESAKIYRSSDKRKYRRRFISSSSSLRQVLWLCACYCVRAYACLYVCVCMRVRTWICACVCVCVRIIKRLFNMKIDANCGVCCKIHFTVSAIHLCPLSRQIENHAGILLDWAQIEICG